MLGRSRRIFETGDHPHLEGKSSYNGVSTPSICAIYGVQHTPYMSLMYNATLATHVVLKYSVGLLESATEHGYLGILAGAWSGPRFYPPVFA